MKIRILGKSLVELLAEYGMGPSGFFSDRWKDEAFAKEKPEPGLYEIDLEKKFTNLTYREQKEGLEAGWDFPHPAVLAEAILGLYKKTGKRPLENWWSRTSSVDSHGFRIYVGCFDSGGLHVYGHWDDYRFDYIGVSAARLAGE